MPRPKPRRVRRDDIVAALEAAQAAVAGIVANAIAAAADARSGLDELREELQSWRDSIPDNLSGGSKAEELNVAIEHLDEATQVLEEVEEMDDPAEKLSEAIEAANSVDFPAMR